MMAVRIVLLCVGAALVCAMLRLHRPEMAVMVSLAVGLAALLLTGDIFRSLSGDVRRILKLASIQPGSASVVLKAAGITILSELGVQICCDAGESALAGRIRLACRAVLLGMAMPFVLEIVDLAALVGV